MEAPLDLSIRLARLERRLVRAQRLAACACLGLGVLVATSFATRTQEADDVIRTRGVEIVDDRGVVRLSLGQDPADTQRRSRSAGLVLYDGTGNERGGFGTMDDGSVVLGMDAPAGVGAAMRDRIGLIVYPTGAAHLILIDNQTRGVAKLYSDGSGGGGVQVFKWDLEQKKVHVKTDTYDGEVHESFEVGG